MIFFIIIIINEILTLYYISTNCEPVYLHNIIEVSKAHTLKFEWLVEV